MKEIEQFESYCTTVLKFSKNTVASYVYDLNLLTKAGARLDQVPDGPRFRSALAKLALAAPSSASRARRLAALRLFAKFRSFEDPRWESLTENFPKGRSEFKIPRALTFSEVLTLLDAAGDGPDPRSLRNRAMLEILYASGLRISEALSLEWTQLKLDEGYCKVLGKGKKERWVPFTERTAAWLQKYRREGWSEWAAHAKKTHRDRVFISHLAQPLSRMAAWKIIHNTALRAGIEDVHPHLLRHSFATHLLDGGADVRFVQALLGHSQLATTERYLETRSEDLRRIFAEHHPLR